MNNFADVEEFAREHARCGGLTPKASSWPGREGYHLEITCACGATHNRWITAEEARQPLGGPASAPSTSPSGPAPAVRAPAARVTTAPAPPVPASVAPAARLSTTAPAPPPTAPVAQAAAAAMPVPLSPEHLITALPGASAPSASVPAIKRSVSWPARPPAPVTARTEVAVAPTPSGSRGRVVWLVLLLLVIGAAGVGTYVFGVPDITDMPDVERLLGQRAKAASPPQNPPPKASPAPVVAAPLPAIDSIAQALRELQGSITPSVALNDYASRVATTRQDVERQLAAAPEPARTHAYEALEIHRLAVSAWRGRTLDERDEWERIGRDATIDLCPAVKRAVEAAAPSRGASRGQARGVAVAALLQRLWECAAEKAALVSSRPAGSAAHPSGA
jgi:hypothetical protein